MGKATNKMVDHVFIIRREEFKVRGGLMELLRATMLIDITVI